MNCAVRRKRVEPVVVFLVMIVSPGAGGCGYISSAIWGVKTVQDIKHKSNEEDRREDRHAQNMKEREEEEKRRNAEAEYQRRIADAERQEANRPKGFPRDRVRPSAAQLSDRIVNQILKQPEIERYFEKYDRPMVITVGDAVDEAKFSGPAEVTEIQSQIMAELQTNQRFSKYFRVIKNRSEVMRKMRNSEGTQEAIFSDDDVTDVYGPTQVCQLDLTLYDYNQKGSLTQQGQTTWKVRAIVSYAKSRSIVVNEAVDVQ